MTRRPDDGLDGVVKQLPRAIEPPCDLWPAIAERLAASPVDTRSLPPSIEPSRDLWGAIEQQTRRPPRWRRAAALPAIAALAAGLLLWLGVWSREQAVPLRPLSRHMLPPAADVRGAPEPAGRELVPGEREMLHAVGEMHDAYQRRRRSIDPKLVATFDESLMVVDDAIERSRSALVDEPSDLHLQRALGHAYRHKLSLLQRASSPRRAR